MHLCQEQLVLRPFQTRSAPHETRRRKTSFWHTRSILLCNNTIRAAPRAAKKKNTDQTPTWSDESNFHVKLLAPSRALVKPHTKKVQCCMDTKKYLAFYFLMQHNRLSYSIISAYFSHKLSPKALFVDTDFIINYYKACLTCTLLKSSKDHPRLHFT